MAISLGELWYTRAVLDYGKKCWNDSNLCKKVIGIAMAILACIPALLIDLCGMVGMGQEDPYRGSFPSSMDGKQFFKDALIAALRLHDRATQKMYKQLILDQGAVAEGDPPICIYRWTAGCMLVHYLKTRGYVEREDLASIMPDADRAESLWDDYKWLPRQQRAKTLLSILKPEGARLNALATQINGAALELTQNRHYLQEIYTPATKELFSP